MKKSIKFIALTGIGIALFVTFTLCLQVPVFENYYLCLGYIVMAVYCYSMGAVSGTIAGCAGTFLYCVLTGGMRGMPGWVIGNLVIGITLGLTFKKTKTLNQLWLKAIINFLAIAISTAVGILVLKSFTECILYAQPFALRAGKNVFAFVADVFVLEVSLPLCMGIDGKLLRIMKF